MATYDTIWYTRCPVPTATGIAADLGWLDDEFAPDGIEVRSLQDVSRDEAADYPLHPRARPACSARAATSRAVGALTAARRPGSSG